MYSLKAIHDFTELSINSPMYRMRNLLKRGVSPVAAKMTASVPTRDQQVSTSTYDVVINANPDYAPYSLLVLEKWWNGMIGTQIVSYCHSSIERLPEYLNLFTQSKLPSQQSRRKIMVNITLIWKKVDIDCELIISPVKQVPIRGEVNLLKFFNRVVNEALGIRADMLQETVLESVLDSCHRLSHSKHTNEYEKLLNNLSSFINKSESFSENNSTLIDLTLWSIISRRRKLSLPTGLKDWYDGVTNFLGVKF